MIEPDLKNDSADDYEAAIRGDVLRDRFPYAGYLDLLKLIQREIEKNHGGAVLDVGAGTGILAERLYSTGHPVTLVDRSARMIEIAGERMRNAQLIVHDLKSGLPPELADRRFDAIVSTYMISGFSDSELVALIRSLRELLAPKGMIYCGGNMFRTAEEREFCRMENEAKWNAEENYPIFEEIASEFGFPARFRRVSYCAGVIMVSAPEE